VSHGPDHVAALRLWHDDPDLPTRLGMPERVVWCEGPALEIDGAVVASPQRVDRAPAHVPVLLIAGGRAISELDARFTIAPDGVWLQAAFLSWLRRLRIAGLVERGLRHDLGSDVAAGRGYADLLQEPETGTLTDRQLRYVRGVGTGIDRLAARLDALAGAGDRALWPARGRAPADLGLDP